MKFQSQAGLSIVEMMVGMVVGLVASLVIMQSFSSSESYRRNISGSSDALQSAAIAAQRMDMLIQEAGAGLARGGNWIWGCKLLADYAGNAVLPSSSSFPPPFSSVPQILRAMPLAIVNGGASSSDVIIVMAGDSASGNKDLNFSSVSGDSLVVTSPALGMALNYGLSDDAFDLVLVAPKYVESDPTDCRIVQIAKTMAPSAVVNDASLGLKVFTSSKTIPLNLTTYGKVDASIYKEYPALYHLGPRDLPSFSLLGVNADSELVLHDLLKRRDPQIVGENVFLIKARYGLDDGIGGAANDNAVDEWVSPAESGWTLPELLDGKRATQQRIGYIKAIRIAMVIRSSQPISSVAPLTSIDLFQDLPSNRRYTKSLTTEEQRYQYQTYEWVIPLRNMRTPPNI